jgi:uncharacterized OB-fold protein
MQAARKLLAVKCPICGILDSQALYPKSLGMFAAQQTIIAYRCSDGHLFLPPHGA